MLAPLISAGRAYDLSAVQHELLGLAAMDGASPPTRLGSPSLHCLLNSTIGVFG